MIKDKITMQFTEKELESISFLINKRYEEIKDHSDDELDQEGIEIRDRYARLNDYVEDKLKSYKSQFYGYVKIGESLIKINNHEVFYCDNSNNYIGKPTYLITNLDSKYTSTVYIPEIEDFLKRKGFTDNEIAIVKEMARSSR